MRFLAPALLLSLAPLALGAQERALKVTMRVDLPATELGQPIKAWVPVPQDTPLQTVSHLTWKAPGTTKLKREHEYGNRYLYIESAGGPASQVELTFDLRRKAAGPQSRDRKPGSLKRLLRADAMVPLDGPVLSELKAATTGKPEGPQLRALYDHVVKTLSYDKSKPGWGQGDVLRVCDVRTGNCTDFHSLLIAMARAKGMPSRFVMGFSVPPKASGELKGYHCWAEVWNRDEKAWFPMDASEASKDLSKADQLYGGLDADRFELSRGRDVRLSPSPANGAQNYLLHPVIEIGKKAQNQPFIVEVKELS